MYRLTRYRQHNLPIDSPGFYVYIKDENGTVWSPGFRPCEVELDSWEAVPQPGMTTFHAEKDGVKAVLNFFMSQTDDVLIWKLDLCSTDGRERRLDVYAYTEFSQLSWNTESLYGYYDRLQLKTWYNKKSSSVNYLFHSGNYPAGHEVPLAYFACSGEVVSYSGNRNTFIGNYGNEALPKGICSDELLNDTISCGEPAAALHNKVVLNKDGSTKEVSFYLGAAQNPINNLPECEKDINNTLAKLRSEGETSR